MALNSFLYNVVYFIRDRIQTMWSAFCSFYVATEICRLRWNWFYLILVNPLLFISYTSIISSFHQFITNPTAQQLNGTEKENKVSQSTVTLFTSITSIMHHGIAMDFCLQIEPELGLPERFYHVAVSSFFIGEFLGALIGGILSSIIPFWYSAMGALLFHTVGFVIYATAVNGWMVIVARILTGFFAGLQVVTILTYFGVSYQHYLDVIGTEERKKEEASTTRVKDQLFAIYMLVGNAGILFGPGWIMCMY